MCLELGIARRGAAVTHMQYSLCGGDPHAYMDCQQARGGDPYLHLDLGIARRGVAVTHIQI